MNKIIENDFSRIDLNLLTVLMVLYREGSVTRTAEVLHLGQPAISGALKRLREMFDDPLFVRSARGMLPTPRAQALMTDLQPLMENLHSAMFGAAEFVPARAQRLSHRPQRLERALADAPAVTRADAGGARVSLQSIAADPFQVRQLLEEERIDVAVSVNKQSRGRSSASR